MVSLQEGEVLAAQIYHSDALQANRRTQGLVEYVIPQEGATLWLDHLVIPQGAKNLEGAYALIQFLLKPEIAAKTTEQMLLAPTLKGVAQSLSAEFRNHPALFPPADVMKRLEMMEDIGNSVSLVDRAWIEIKAAP
jgi:spermidine/putrescine-binding protein